MPRYTPEEARMLSPLQLAYVGDSVQTLWVRTRLVKQNLPVHAMHTAATQAVNAVAQSRALTALLPRLTEEELLIVKRGRNAHTRHNAPKSATVGEYASATGLEALLGYLYLTGAEQRLTEIFHWMTEE